MNSSKIKNKASFKKAVLSGFKGAWDNLGVVMLATTTIVLFSSLTMFIAATIFRHFHVNDKIVLSVTPIPMSFVFWIPVSYTHLDVYKRQEHVWSEIWMISGLIRLQVFQL